MKVMLICLFFFFTELQNGELGFVQGRTFTEMEGNNITVSCSFAFNGGKMYFCRTDCSRENVLVETTDYRAQSGRYIIEFNKTDFASHVVYVSITELKTSDSGWYRCTLGITGIQRNDFKISVISASPTSTTSTGSLSFSSSSPPFFSEITKHSNTSAPPTGVLLPVGVVLTITIIVLAAALLVSFKYKRSQQHKGSAEPAGGTEYATIIKPNKSIKRETETQITVESDSLDYSEVHFSKRTTNLHSSAP